LEESSPQTALGHNLLVFTNDEVFAASVLANLQVAAIPWTGGGDPDELEERFRRGKRSLKKKFQELAREPEPDQTNG
jgi:hypothetical protein